MHSMATDHEDQSDLRRQAGRWLAAARVEKGFTQKELELAASLGSGNITNYERGLTRVPDDAAERIAEALGIGIIETRRQLNLWVPKDAADSPRPRIDLRQAIREDETLVPEARKHLENQLVLLRRLSETSTLPTKADLLEEQHAARKRSPRKPRA